VTAPFINVDAGEDLAQRRRDLELLPWVGAVNIALGGHAGDPDWARDLAARAAAEGLRVHLHPGYPDREHFGRRALPMDWTELSASLTRQRAALPDVEVCKFHGALYNQAATDRALAENLAGWCVASRVTEVLTPPDSALAAACASAGVRVVREGFADRSYTVRDGRLGLAPRTERGAVLTEPAACVAQAMEIVEHGRVVLVEGRTHALVCDTLCVHGDTEDALAIVKRLCAVLRGSVEGEA